jgi:hypothetical protein
VSAVHVLRGISRIDQDERPDGRGATHAWYVRIGKTQEGLPRHVGSFSDALYGGVKQSLEAAISFRDSVLRRGAESVSIEAVH